MSIESNIKLIHSIIIVKLSKFSPLNIISLQLTELFDAIKLIHSVLMINNEYIINNSFNY